MLVAPIQSPLAFESAMEELTSFSATLSHRHYGEGAFEHRKKQISLKNLKIMTYGSATGAKSLFRYVSQEYLKYADGPPATVLIGLSGVADLNENGQLELATRIVSIANQERPVDLYLHAACHIKLLSHDGKAYLGSQNLSNGAEPYFTGANSGKQHFHRFHEAILKVEDQELSWVENLFDRVLADHPLWVKVTQEHTQLERAVSLVTGFVKNAQLKRVVDHLSAVMDLDVFIQSGPEFMSLEFNSMSNNELCKSLSDIAAAEDAAPFFDLFKSDLLPDSDFSWFKHEARLEQLKGIITAVGEGFREKRALEEIIENDTPLYLNDHNDQRLIERIRGIVIRHDLESLEDYVLRNRGEIIHSIMESPDYSQDYMFGAIDNDGNVDESMLNQRFSSSIVEWDEDSEGESHCHERDVMTIKEKLHQIDTAELRADLYAVFNTEVNALWGNEVLNRAEALSMAIKKVYAHELKNKVFMDFVKQLRAGKSGNWSQKWLV